MTDYTTLFATLVEKSGLSSEEIESQLKIKIESLGHLVNEDVALRLVARDLNISLSDGEARRPCVQVVDLVPGMNNINLELAIESSGTAREFTKKDGTVGKLLRVLASDESGKVPLVAWDEQTVQVEPLGAGTKVFVHSAYTKSGLSGGVEIHLGRRSKLEVVSSSANVPGQQFNDKHEGIVWRTSDLKHFSRKDGSSGTLASFLLKEGNETLRVLLWNPQVEKLSDLKEGVFVEITGGSIRNDMGGRPELHVNDIGSIKVRQGETVEIGRSRRKLSEISPDMSDVDLEVVVENVFEMASTYNGKSYLRMLLREGETVLPMTLWNEKALEFDGRIQAGTTIRIENCFSKIGPQGIEIGVNRWSRISII